MLCSNETFTSLPEFKTVSELMQFCLFYNVFLKFTHAEN